MTDSPLEQLLAAVDSLDVEAMLALFTPDARLLAIDGRRLRGEPAIREFVEQLFGSLRAVTHRITSQWHMDDVWIGEVEADYEFDDWLQRDGLARAFVLRATGDRIADLRVYGAHEPPLTEHPTAEDGTWVGGHWIPPL